jgi:hypothetical protein
MTQPEPSPDEMTPERAQAVARLLFILTPVSFLLAWALSAVQGADTRTCLIISVVGMLMCLAAALLFKLRGVAAKSDAVWIQTILAIVVALTKRR